jgi:hypothetical protein
MSTPQEKGGSLERAVLAIERTILKASHLHSEKSFRVEARRIVNVASVRHEIDIWVELDLGSGYTSVFIFECKNWVDSVGKNEIIVFSEKIRALSAQRGFFVAREYTRDAVAQAALDPRIELLQVESEEYADLVAPLAYHVLAVDNQKYAIELVERALVRSGQQKAIDLTHATASLNGDPIDLADYVSRWHNAVCNSRSNRFPSQVMPAGVYSLEAEDSRTFEQGQLVVDSMDIAEAKMKLTFTAEVIRPAIISSFEVKGRGRVWQLAPVAVGGGKLEHAIIETVK